MHDDSMSSLLYAGQRKKMSGTTSYKRPGPPTPSKNGGRLSLGGTGEVHSRQILKEINESTKQQTPSTLRAIFSRKSLVRDEVMSVESCQSSCSVVEDDFMNACCTLKGQGTMKWFMGGDRGGNNEDTSSLSDTPTLRKRRPKRGKVSINMTHLQKRRFSNVLQCQRKRRNSVVSRSKSNRRGKFDEFRSINNVDASELWIEEDEENLNTSAEKKFEMIAQQKISQTPFLQVIQKSDKVKRRFSTPIQLISSPSNSKHSSAKCSGGVSFTEKIPRSEVIKLPRRQLIQKQDFVIKRTSILFAILIIIFAFCFAVVYVRFNH